MDLPTGVLTGDRVQQTFALAKQKGFALPAANCIGSSSMNAVMETAIGPGRASNHPVLEPEVAPSSPVKESVRVSKPRSPVQSPAHSMSAPWLRIMAPTLCCTPTMRPRSFFPGSMACSMPARTTSPLTVSRCSVPTCWIYPKNRSKKTSISASSI